MFDEKSYALFPSSPQLLDEDNICNNQFSYLKKLRLEQMSNDLLYIFKNTANDGQETACARKLSLSITFFESKLLSKTYDNNSP